MKGEGKTKLFRVSIGPRFGYLYHKTKVQCLEPEETLPCDLPSRDALFGLTTDKKDNVCQVEFLDAYLWEHTFSITAKPNKTTVCEIYSKPKCKLQTTYLELRKPQPDHTHVGRQHISDLSEVVIQSYTTRPHSRRKTNTGIVRFVDIVKYIKIMPDDPQTRWIGFTWGLMSLNIPLCNTRYMCNYDKNANLYTLFNFRADEVQAARRNKTWLAHESLSEDIYADLEESGETVIRCDSILFWRIIFELCGNDIDIEDMLAAYTI